MNTKIETVVTNKDSSLSEESLKNIFADIVKYFPSKLAGVLGNILVVPIYTNLLSPEQYGLYNVAIGVLSFLCIIFSDWVGNSGLRFFRAHQIKDEIPKYFSTLLFLLVSNLIIMFGVVWIVENQIADFFKIPSDMLIIVLLLIVPVSFRALMFQVLRAQIKPIAYTISTILNQITTILLAVYFMVFHKMGAMSIIFGMGLSITVIDVILIFQSRMLSGLKLEKINFAILNSFYKYGIPIAASALSMWMITQSNKFILQYFKGSFFNGLTGVGFNLTFSILMPLFSVMTIAAFPRIINKFEAGIDVRPVLSRLTGYFIAFALPIVVLISVYAKDIVLLLANSKFQGAAEVVPYLAFSVFFLGLADYTTIQYHLVKKTYLDTFIKLIPGAVGVIVNIILIPKYGILGVGISTLISNLLYFMLSIVINVKNLTWIVPYHFIKSSFISFIPVIIMLWYVESFNLIHFYAGIQMLVLLAMYFVTFRFVHKKLV